jgi:protein-L-isoaspartate(D-aspartate) O-methyltransferase
MDTSTLRRAYAEKIRDLAGIHSGALTAAFATVPRERFLGPGPWLVLRPGPTIAYDSAPSAQLPGIYDDVLVAIDPGRHLNNGQPSAHALWIDAAGPRPGESVMHLGCGTGYYTAILAELVGASGRVLALEVDGGLAERARECLAPWPQVQVESGDGSQPHGPHDVIYVNAGATHARKEWLAALAPGGRLVLPLTVHVPILSTMHGVGFVIRSERQGQRWPVRVVSPVGIFDCCGARDEAAEAQLRGLLKPEAMPSVCVLSIEPHARAPSCLLHVDGFCLSRG